MSINSIETLPLPVRFRNSDGQKTLIIDGPELIEAIRERIPDLSQREEVRLGRSLWEVLEYLSTRAHLPREVALLQKGRDFETHFLREPVQKYGILVTVNFRGYMPGQPLELFSVRRIDPHEQSALLGWAIKQKAIGWKRHRRPH